MLERLCLQKPVGWVGLEVGAPPWDHLRAQSSLVSRAALSFCSAVPRRPVEGGRGGHLTVTPRPPLLPLSSLPGAGHPRCDGLIPRLR